MKVWKLIAATEFLGSKVITCGYKEVEAPKGVEYGKQYYDKMGNQHGTYIYFEDIADVDATFIKAYRKLKGQHGRDRMPEHSFEFYQETYERAVKDYPDILV
jgi:hypothetical protein